MFTRKMNSYFHTSLGSGSHQESSQGLDTCFPLTPEELNLDSDSSRDHEEMTPCFPLTPDDLYLDPSPSMLAGINSCSSVEEITLCSPHDQTLRELSLCSPVTPSDVDVNSPRAPLDLNFPTSEVSVPSPVIAHVISEASSGSRTSLASSLTRNDVTLSFFEPLDGSSSVHTSEDLNPWSPDTPSETGQDFLWGGNSRERKSRAELPQELKPRVSEMPSKMMSPPPKAKAEFLPLGNTGLLEQSQQPVLMPSTRVDPSSTSTPYTDAAQARKPARQGHIKRPMNAFMIWAQQQRHQIIAKYPGSDNAKISKFLGSSWKKLSEKEKAPYREEADRLKMLHLKEFPEYKYQPRKAAKRKSSKTEAAETDTDQPSGGGGGGSGGGSSKKRETKRSPLTKSRSRKPPRRGGGDRFPSHSPSDSESQDFNGHRDLRTPVLHSDSSPNHTEPDAEKGFYARRVLGVVADQVKDAQKWDSCSSADVIGGSRVFSSVQIPPSRESDSLHTPTTTTTTTTSSPGNTHPRIATRFARNSNIDNNDDDSNSNSNSNDDDGDGNDHNNNATSNITDKLAADRSGGSVHGTRHTHTSVKPPRPETSPIPSSTGEAPHTSSRGTSQPTLHSRHHTAATAAQLKTSNPETATFQNVRLQPAPRGDAGEDPASGERAAAAAGAAAGEEAAAAAALASETVVLQELAFSEDELNQLFATSTAADEGAFLSLVKYVIC